MSMEKELLEALKAIAEGQKQIVEEIKKLGDQQELVPMKMPDGSTRLVDRLKLTAQTTALAAKPSQMKIVEHPPLIAEPWPDPATPKPPLVR
jgi:hypothetical protein